MPQLLIHNTRLRAIIPLLPFILKNAPSFSGWFFNQLDLAGLAWRTKNSLFDRVSIGAMELCVKGEIV